MVLYIVAALVMTSVMFLVYGLISLAPTRSRVISQRLGELQEGAHQHFVIERRRRQDKREKLEAMLETFGERVSSKRVNWSKMQHLLVMAGYRRPNAVALFFAARLIAVTSLGLVSFVAATTVGAEAGVVMLATGFLAAFGWIAPKFFVNRRVRKRQTEITHSLPDTLDLLVVCVEAGLGLNQALLRVSDEISHVSEVMAAEMTLTNLEIRAGTPRDEALRNLGERTGNSDLKSLTAMLVQTDRFGTSIATALRVHADTLRTKRRQRAEEAAAKTTIKLVFPLVLFIFPAMFVVILGPAILHITEQMQGLM